MSVADVVSRCRRAVGLLAVAACATTGIALAAAPAAHADPSASELEHQMESTWTKLEAAGENYKAAVHQLKVNQRKSKKLAKQLKPLNKRVNAMYKEVGAYAAAAYKGGNLSAFNSLLTTGSATTTIDNLALLNRLSAEQNARAAKYVKLKNELDSKKAKFDKLAASNKKQAKKLAAEKKSLNASMNKMQVEYQQTAASDTGSPELNSLHLPYVPGPAGIAVRYAEQQLGKPYVWDTAGPDTYDCSGLTMASWAQAGVHMQHYTGDQYAAFPHVSRSDIMAGDLIFYNGGEHVAIYIGKGYVIHAPEPGEDVKISPIDYPGSWYGAVRP